MGTLLKLRVLLWFLTTSTAPQKGKPFKKDVNAVCGYHGAFAEASQGAATSKIISAAFIE